MNATAGSLRRLLASSLNVRPREGRRTLLLFAQLFLAAAIFVLGRTVRDTLFLSRYSLSALPWMFVLYGLVSAATAVGYGRVADRLPRDRVIVASCAIGGVTYLAAWVLVRLDQTWIYPTFYVWSEVVANLLIVQFWTLANDLHDPRSAKRLFPVIGAGRVLGGMVVGLAAGACVKALGTAQMLFVLVCLMAGVALLALRLGREPRAEGAGRGAAPSRRRPAPGAWLLKDAYVRSLSVITLLAFTALTVGDYQFKAIARAAFTEDDLARFFSLFYAGTGLVSFLFQILVTPRLLARLGVQAGMSVMPGLFGLASAGLLLGPRLVVATIAKFADNGFQYTIHETTLQALYVPFAARTKARTRAFLDAVVKPLSYGAGGLALVLLAPRVEVHLLSWLTVPLVALWLLAVPKARRLYLARLEKSLSSRGALALEAESQLDAAGRQLLLRALESDDGRRARLALEQLATEGQVELQVPLERLARHPDPSLRASALRHLAGLPGVAPAVTRGSLADPDPRVRVAAALAHAATAKDDAVSGLRELLEDGSASVRSAAAAALYRHAGLEGTLVASRHLQGLLDAGSPERRAEAAEVLGHLGEGAYRPLARLLSDPAMVVRRAALRAAGGVPDPRLLPTLLEALRDPATRQRAARALVALGSPAVPALLALLEGAAPRPLRLEVPRLLRRIPCRAAYDGLRSSLGSPDSHLRLRVLAALSGLREELRRPAEPRRFVLDLVRAELVEALGNLAGWEAARPIYGSRLLAQEFEFRQSRAVRRVLRILELRFEREPLRLIKSYLGDPRRRPAALEVLDTLLDPPLRSLVMPFLDDLPAAERIRRAGALVPPVAEPGAFLLEQCRHPNPYVALLALDTLGRRKELTVRPAALLALEHDDPLVREGGVWALSAVDLEEAARRLPPLVSDPDPVVARCARWALERRPLDASQENVMLGTIEKVLFLMSAPIFEQLSAEDLAPLARVAEVEAFATGEALFSEGEVGDALYVVTQGRVAIERQGEAIAEVGAGECLGEMSVLDAEARSATARALEETEALRIGGEEFQELLHEQAEIASGVIQVLTKRLRETNARLAALRGDAGRST